MCTGVRLLLERKDSPARLQQLLYTAKLWALGFFRRHNEVNLTAPIGESGYETNLGPQLPRKDLHPRYFFGQVSREKSLQKAANQAALGLVSIRIVLALRVWLQTREHTATKASRVFMFRARRLKATEQNPAALL